MKFADLAVGQTATLTKKITDAVVRQFAELSEDRNPVHLDDNYAATSFFKRRIAHGMIGASLVSAVIGMQLPGPGSIFVATEIKFRAPVYIDETVVVNVSIREMRADKMLVFLDAEVVKEDGSNAITGTATIKLFE
jgi:3-hydroxybutyryl-CoA dehydratase